MIDLNPEDYAFDSDIKSKWSFSFTTIYYVKYGCVISRNKINRIMKQFDGREFIFIHLIAVYPNW